MIKKAIPFLIPLIFLIYVIYLYLNFPDYEKFKKEFFRPSDRVVLDRNYYPLSIIRKDFDIRRTGYVRLSEVNSDFLRYLINSEDKRFYSHPGFDIISLGSSFIDILKKGRIRGASTIDMQFIRNYYNLKGENPLLRKAKEILFSIIMEIKWSKEEILEAYINTVPVKGEISGIHTASWGLFGKSPQYINNAESVILLSLIRKPSSDKEEILKGSLLVAKRLGIFIDSDELREKIERLLKGYRIENFDLIPNLSTRLLEEGSSPVVTTLDLTIQNKAIEILKSFVGELKVRNLNDAALIVIDNKSAEVLAYVPNAFELSSRRYVDGVRAKRQAGSTLKPFLYEYLIENRILTAASILDDSPIYVSKNGLIYSPQNYDRTYKGPVSTRSALASSLNIPAIRAIMMAGVPEYTSRLKRLGFDVKRSEEIEDYYGESLALGTLDVSLFELARAYLILANNGIYRDLRIKEDDPVREFRLLDEKAVFIIKDILSDREARSLTFGLENTLSTPFYTSVKTGTSKDMRDNWCIGFSERFTVGVWTGNFSGEPMYNVSGSHGASQIWFAVMKELHKKVVSRAPVMPEGVIKKRISYRPPIEPPRDEYFIKGTEPIDGEIVLNYISIPRILYPPKGAILAIDPEIPETQQKLYVYTNCNDCSLAGDTAVIDKRNNIFIVDIARGRHILRLIDSLGTVVDRTEYEVR